MVFITSYHFPPVNYFPFTVPFLCETIYALRFEYCFLYWFSLQSISHNIYSFFNYYLRIYYVIISLTNFEIILNTLLTFSWILHSVVKRKFIFMSLITLNRPLHSIIQTWIDHGIQSWDWYSYQPWINLALFTVFLQIFSYSIWFSPHYFYQQFFFHYIYFFDQECNRLLFQKIISAEYFPVRIISSL